MSNQLRSPNLRPGVVVRAIWEAETSGYFEFETSGYLEFESPMVYIGNSRSTQGSLVLKTQSQSQFSPSSNN